MTWTFLAGLTLALCVTSPSRAERPSLVIQASTAWEAAELSRAAELYEEALKQGGLQPADVLVAYARIGTVRAAMSNKVAALSAFRVAAALNPTFELPSEAGPKAAALYKKARADADQRGGKLELKAEVPTQGAAGAEFVVVAHMPEAFVPLIVDIGIAVYDPSLMTSVKPWSTKKPSATQVRFEVPGRVVLAGASLLVRVDALDEYGNSWVSAQSRVRVQARNDDAYATFGTADDPFRDDTPKQKPAEKSKGYGFWSSPWPWVIGGAVVVGGTAAYLMTRPTNDVTVSEPAWR
jgi:hypothetical protein